jgi:hypothetical protein
MKLILSLISLAVVLSMIAPSYVYGQNQIAALPPAVGPTTTSMAATTMPIAQCIDFNSDGVCEYVVLANGTMITNPSQGQLVQQQPTNPMTQLVERQKIIIKEQQRADNDNDDDPRDDPDCWYGNLYVCNEDGDCDSENFDCLTECADGSSVTTGEDCPDENDESDEPADDDLPNCNDVEAGTHCDGTEDEDSWTDEEEEESSDEEEEENFSDEEAAADEDVGAETFG